MALVVPRWKGIENLTAPEFRLLDQHAAAVGATAGALATVIEFEPAGTFSPSIRNPTSGATGLIQFTASTAKTLGTTLDALAKMTFAEQLLRVRQFYLKVIPAATRARGGMGAGELYVATFAPAALGTPNGHAIFKRGSKAYEQNAGLDTDKDGAIRTGELRRRMEARERPRGTAKLVGDADDSIVTVFVDRDRIEENPPVFDDPLGPDTVTSSTPATATQGEASGALLAAGAVMIGLLVLVLVLS
jgi:hypothetical protein